MQKRKHLGANKALNTIDYILGDKSKNGFNIPVNLNVGITPELNKSVLTIAAIFAGAIVLSTLIKYRK